MKLKVLRGVLGAGGVALLLLLPAQGVSELPAEARVPIRIGWQVSSATQAQLMQVPR